MFTLRICVLVAVLLHCYNAPQRMADWKQITARIRRARTGKDPAGQLSNLFEKTHDAMVAFELARHFETSGLASDAAKWYVVAAERFRRADWKAKAMEAAARLGGEISQSHPDATDSSSNSNSDPLAGDRGNLILTPPSMFVPEPGLPFEQNAEVFETITTPEAIQSAGPSSPPEPATRLPDDKTRRRRGRRGGRNRRKPSTSRTSGANLSQRSAPSSEESSESDLIRTSSESLPRLPVETLPESGASSVRGRYGDPGLSSRLSLLEMQFRRLLTCTPARLDETDRVPVGPGVFLLTDSDLTSYYYVEACQTLRIAVPNLLRGGSSHRGNDSIKPRLAEHLGIAESRVAKYLADHCVVRWLQLDEGASHFAHFVIAVLRPSLNE